MLGTSAAAADDAANHAELSAARHGRRFADGPDDEFAEPAGASPALPSTIFVAYESSGGPSERAVTLQQVWRTDGCVYFSGRCHLRKTRRTFRADRVTELICLATGEVADYPEAWLTDHALFEEKAQDHTAKALRLCRADLLVLAYMGRSDGHFDPEEIEVAVDHVMMASEEEIDRRRAAVYIARLSPSLDDLEGVLRRLAKDAPRWERLKRSIRRLVNIDQELSTEEQRAWVEIEELQSAAAAEQDALEERRWREIEGLLRASPYVVSIGMTSLPT